MKIVILDGYTLNPGDLSWEPLKELGEVTVYERTAPKDVCKRAEGAEVVFTNKVVLDEAVLEKLPSLKYIGVLATGYNVVDVAAAARKGIGDEYSGLQHQFGGSDGVCTYSEYCAACGILCPGSKQRKVESSG